MTIKIADNNEIRESERRERKRCILGGEYISRTTMEEGEMLLLRDGREWRRDR